MLRRDLFGRVSNFVRYSVGLPAKYVRVAASVGGLNDRFVAERDACEARECLCRVLFHVLARGCKRGGVLCKG